MKAPFRRGTLCGGHAPPTVHGILFDTRTAPPYAGKRLSASRRIVVPTATGWIAHRRRPPAGTVATTRAGTPRAYTCLQESPSEDAKTRPSGVVPQDQFLFGDEFNRINELSRDTTRHQDRLSRSKNSLTITRLNKNRTGGRLEQKLALGGPGIVSYRRVIERNRRKFVLNARKWT